jgi:hypothetical protein
LQSHFSDFAVFEADQVSVFVISVEINKTMKIYFRQIKLINNNWEQKLSVFQEYY